MFVYGLYVKPVKRGPMQNMEEVSISVEDGVVGDSRGSRTRKNGERQVVVTSLQQWEAACRAAEVKAPPSARRGNICLSGYSFGPSDVGKRIHMGDGIILEVTGEATPCPRMEEVAPYLEKILSVDWRGGVTCRVVREGKVKVNTVASIA